MRVLASAAAMPKLCKIGRLEPLRYWIRGCLAESAGGGHRSAASMTGHVSQSAGKRLGQDFPVVTSLNPPVTLLNALA